MKMRRAASALLCVMLLLSAIAHGVPHAPMRFQRVSSSEGLINDFVKCLYKDHLGYLWVGTFDGLCRWDGATFKSFRREFGNTATLPSNTILALAEDKYGVLWISTGKGICSFDPRTQSISRHTLFRDEPVAYTMAMKAVNDTMLITTQTALYRLHIDGPGVLRAVARIPFPQIAGTDGLLEKLPSPAIVLHQGHVYHISGTALQDVSPKDGHGRGIPVCDAVITPTGNYYAEALRPGILLYHEGGSAIAAFHPDPALVGEDDHFNKMLLPAASFPGQNILLLGSTKSGLLKLDIVSGAFTAYRHERMNPFSLSSNEVMDFVEAPNGFVFTGTRYGLNIYDSHNQRLQTTVITKKGEPLQDLITDAVEDEADKDLLWLGTSASGLLRYRYSKSDAARIDLPKAAGAVRCLFQSTGGSLRIGCEGGLYELPEGSSVVRKSVAQILQVSSIREIAPHVLLITSFTDGCLIYNAATGATKRISARGNGLFSDRCSNSAPIPGTGYYAITHIGAGVSILNPATGGIRIRELQTALETETSYPATYTYCGYAPDDSMIWIGTGLGLVRLNIRSGSAQIIKNSTRLRTDSEIWSILPGGGSSLWLKTTFGVYLFDSRSGVIVTFYPLSREHIPAQDGYFRMRQAGSRIIIPSFGKVDVLSTDANEPPVYDMKLVLSEMKADGEPFLFHPDEREISLTLKPGHASLDLAFSALQFRKTPYIIYMYKMGGGDDVWHDLGNKNFLSFPNLDAGHYSLMLSARDFEGHNIAMPLTINIRVAPYLWQSPWFYLALTVLLALGVYALYRYRLAQVLQLQQVRQKISKDLHDDIGATVSSISILASMTKAREISADRKEQFLQSIADNSRYVTEALSDIVWSINPRNDTLEHIFARLQRYASELFEARDIAYTMTLPDSGLHAQSLSMDTRQQLLLIFKEAVNNLIKYSGAAHAQVTFSVQGGKLIMRVSDDGKGFEPDAAHEGNGVHNMRKRAEELKGHLAIISKTGKGTTILLEVPL